MSITILPKGCRYLATNVMRATSSMMTLASTILGFDVIELWTESLDDGNIRCTYVYATDLMKKTYPDLIFGHYPDHKKEHKLSPMVSIYSTTTYLFYFRVHVNN